MNEQVRTVLCETNPSLRTGIRTALFARGFRELTVCKDAPSLLATLEQEIVDLVICDVNLPGMDFCDMIQSIRQNTLGHNPFALIVATATDTSLPEVRRIINAGVDDLICKPMPMNVIGEHLSTLLQARRPFVATDSYVGPNRRARMRPEDEGSVIHVPNSLRSKVVEKVGAGDLRGIIDRGWASLQHKRAELASGRISRLAGRILACYRGEGDAETVAADMAALRDAAAALARRSQAGSHLGELAASLAEVAERLSRSPKAPKSSHLELLGRLGDAIHLSLAGKGSSSEVTQTMARTVARLDRSARRNAG